MYVKERCDKVHELYICKSKLEVTPNGEERCLRAISNADLAVCDAIEVDEQERILEPEKGKILVLNGVRTQIHSNCVRPFQVKGNALITYKDCNITINGFTYGNEAIKMDGKIKLAIPLFKGVEINNTMADLNLQKLHWESVKSRNKLVYD